jgi:hypothetical protein
MENIDREIKISFKNINFKYFENHKKNIQQ